MSVVTGMRELRDVSRFELIASAIAGRSVRIEPADEGSGAWTDSATIFVNPDVQIGTPLDGVVVQSALLGAGSLDAEVLDRLVRSTKLCRRYLPLRPEDRSTQHITFAFAGHRVEQSDAP
jgi:hypothetical protein